MAPDTLASQLPILSDIQWQTFDSNFLAMYAASSMTGTTMTIGVVVQHATSWPELLSKREARV